MRGDFAPWKCKIPTEVATLPDDESKQLDLVAAGLPLPSKYLLRDYFSADLLDQFIKAGHQPDNIWYMGYFLPDNKNNQESIILSVYQQFKAHALKQGLEQLCYVDVVNPIQYENSNNRSPEPWGSIIPGFIESTVRIKTAWPTYQQDGQVCDMEHELEFYLKNW